MMWLMWYDWCDSLSVSDCSLIRLLSMILFFNRFNISMNSLFFKVVISESLDQPIPVLTYMQVLWAGEFNF